MKMNTTKIGNDKKKSKILRNKSKGRSRLQRGINKNRAEAKSNKTNPKLLNFKFTEEDLHQLYDLIYLIDDNVYSDIKLNKMDKWLKDFHKRVEAIVLK